MFKKVLAVILALVMIFSVSVVATSGADEIAPSGDGNVFHFIPSGWNNFTQIFCHIVAYGDDHLADWQSKAEKCVDNGDGTWTYDPGSKGISLVDGVPYYVIFSTNTGVETYPCLMDTTCFGDTLYLTGDLIENPWNSNVTTYEALWKNQDKSVYGPVLMISSIGNIVGSVCAPYTAPYPMFVEFLKGGLQTARAYSGKDDQTLIDDIGRGLGLTADEVEYAIIETGVSLDWRKDRSTLPGGTPPGPPSGNVFYFEPSGWSNFERLYCHIWEYGGDSLADWHSKAEKCVKNGDGTWIYDLDEKGFTLKDGVWYCIMFSADTNVETYQCLMDTTCLGDTMYMTGNWIENPIDSSRICYEAVFQNHDKNVYGPVLAITSIGNVVGSAPPPGKTGYDLFVDFLANDLYNALSYTGKDEQTLLDEIGGKLGLTAGEVERAIREAGVTVNWRKDRSSLPDNGDPQPTEPIDTKGSVFFDADSAGWRNFSYIICHIYEYDGYSFFDWMTKKERCEDIGNGIFKYSLDEKGISLRPGKCYCVIFADNLGRQTFPLLMDTSCIGDTAFMTGNMMENPADSNKVCFEAYWKSQDKRINGPVLTITTIGNVVGVTCAPCTSPYQMFVKFLREDLQNARAYSGKDDQRLLDDIAAALELNADDVEKALKESCASGVGWKKENSPLPAGDPNQTEPPATEPTEPPTEPEIMLGDVDGDGVISVLDATRIQKFKAKLVNLDGDKYDGAVTIVQLRTADVDSDGVISVMDATRIQKYKAKLMNLDGSTPYTG